MTNIAGYINNIRNAMFGKDVRESIASGLEAINSEIENFIDTRNHENLYIIGDDKIVLDNQTNTLTILDGCFCVVPDLGVSKLSPKAIDISNISIGYAYMLHTSNYSDVELSLYSENLSYNDKIIGILFGRNLITLNNNVVKVIDTSGNPYKKLDDNIISDKNKKYAQISLINKGIKIDFKLMKIIIEPDTFATINGVVVNINSSIKAISIPKTQSSSACYLVYSNNEIKCIDRKELKVSDYIICSIYQYEVGGINYNKLNIVNEIKNINTKNNIINSIRDPFEFTKVKLLGDSITAGVGGTGYSATGELIGETEKRANEVGYCWANELKKNLEKFNKDVYVLPSHSNIAYDGEYSILHDRNTYLCERVTVVGVGKSICTRFYGNYIDINYGAINTGAILDIEIDGIKKGTLDTYSSENKYKQVHKINGLSNGYHDLKLTIVGKNDNSFNYGFSFEGFKLKKHITVKNWGISGWDANNMYKYKENLVEQDDTHIIMQIGTNDRIASKGFTNSEYVTYSLSKMCIDYWNSLGISCILSVANPCTIENEQSEDYNFSIADLHKVVFELGENSKIDIINNYQAILDYCLYNNIDLKSIVSDMIHPNDLGYKVMFNNVMKELQMPIFIK